MALDAKDLEALQLLIRQELEVAIEPIREGVGLLIREEIKTGLEPFRKEFAEFRNETQSNFDALFARDEDREQEYKLLTKQVSRLEKKVA